MITITFDGKTYKITRFDWIITQLWGWIKSGALEEIKENKEPETTQFTPWQMIEVSQDGEKWEEEEFIGFTVEKKFFCKNKHWRCSFCKYARPLEKKEKMIEIPDFDSNKLEVDSLKAWAGNQILTVAYAVDRLWEQVEALTSHLKAMYNK